MKAEVQIKLGKKKKQFGPTRVGDQNTSRTRAKSYDAPESGGNLKPTLKKKERG